MTANWVLASVNPRDGRLQSCPARSGAGVGNLVAAASFRDRRPGAERPAQFRIEGIHGFRGVDDLAQTPTAYMIFRTFDSGGGALQTGCDEQGMNEDEIPKLMGEVIQIDEARIRGHLGEMVRGTIEEAQNAMLDAEADRPCGARIAMNAARDARTRGLGLVKGRRTSGLAGSA